MVRILIYDDSSYDRKQLKILIDNLFSELNITYSIKECLNDEEFYNSISSSDLLFLDIELNKSNGIEIGKKIKETNSDCRIIITSRFNKYLIDGYKIHADRYFLKPINEIEFSMEMKNILKEYFKQNFSIRDEKICRVPISLKKILYIEAYDKYTVLHMSNDAKLKTPYRLKYWTDKLKDYDFCQSHKSYLVNLSNVSGIKKTDVVLFSNELVPLSRHYKADFENYFMKLLFEEI